MIILDLFCGTKSIANTFEDRGHEVYTVDWDDKFNPSLVADIGTLTANDIIDLCGGVPDVIWSSPDCFVKGTLVNTSDGYKNIENVQIGDEVLTHKGEYKKVYNTIAKRTNEVQRLKIAGCEEFFVTGNHPFLARKKVTVSTRKNGRSLHYVEMSEPCFVEAKDLDNSYRVGIVINQNNTLPQWNGVKKIHKNQNGYYKEYYENRLSNLFNNNDFWWMIGRYLGDGTNTYIENRKYQFEICCNKNNNETQEIKEVLDRLPFKYCISEKKTTNVFCINQKELSYFATKFGNGANEKFIPKFALDLPKHLLKSLIDGYLSADGNFDKRYNAWRLTTVSEKMAYSFQMALLKSYSRYCSIVTKNQYESVIEGRKVKCNKAYILGFYLSDNHLQYKIEDGYAWVNIKDNIVMHNETDVYTLSVEDDESYCVRNIIVHNCTTYSVAAISKHRRKDENGNLVPISDYAKKCDETNRHLIELIKELNPKYFFIENPRAGFRKMDFIQDIPRYTVCYCKYGDKRMKPTDIFTNHPNPDFIPPCKNGDKCHESAPRGSRTGTQGLKDKVEKARIPKKLCEHIVDICENNISSDDI